MTDTLIPQALQDAVADAAGADHTVSIAYSGGLDSRFLAFVSKFLGYRVRLLHVAGPHMAPSETAQAVADARAMGIEPELIMANPLGITDLASAGKNRCYVCKHHVFTELLARTTDKKLCDGTNKDDLSVYRPGRKALAELGIYSPLAKAGFGKKEIRATASKLEMPRPDQAARPCLLTRFPYGVMPDEATLKLTAAAEDWLEAQPECAHLRFRLRFPDPARPYHAELHVEEKSLEGLSKVTVDAVAERLKAHFAPDINDLTVRVMVKLSGFYDRAN